MKCTELLAIWGAVLSTTAMVWNFLRSRHDSGRLKVRVGVIYKASSEYTGHRIRFSAVNTGRRALIIAESWHIKTRDGRDHSYSAPDQPDALPKKLEEGEEASNDFDPSAFDFALVAQLANSSQVYALDSKGKKWKVKRWPLRKARKLLIKMNLHESWEIPK